MGFSLPQTQSKADVLPAPEGTLMFSPLCGTQSCLHLLLAPTPFLLSPALRSLCSPPGQCSLPGICWPNLAGWCEVFSFLPLLILFIPSISKQNHNISRLPAHSFIATVFCGLGCLLVDNEGEDDPSCIPHPSRKACQASQEKINTPTTVVYQGRALNLHRERMFKRLLF